MRAENTSFPPYDECADVLHRFRHNL